MGVSGCGKSTIGALLGQEFDIPYMDGDLLHPQANIDKMAAGIPLNDDDRWPWLTDVALWLKSHEQGSIIGCSALKRAYRDVIRNEAPDALFAHLHGEEDLLHARMRSRPGHFMPPDLLKSQLDTLEPLGPDEAGRVFDIEKSERELVDEIAAWIAEEDC